MDASTTRPYLVAMATTVSEASLLGLMDLLEAGRSASLPPEGLPMAVLKHAQALVPCDAVTYAELDAVRRHHPVAQVWPGEGDDGPDEQLFWEHFLGCLACSYPERTGDLRTVTMISDFYSTRQFHSSGMYVDFLGPQGVEHEVMVSLSAPAGRSRRLVFFRGPGRDFDDRERLLLSLLRPHLDELCREFERRRLPASPLTPRQAELLALVARGHSNTEIARILSLSAGTVRKHLENIFERLGVSSRTAAVAAVLPAGSAAAACWLTTP
jgi:DNA-binding CsgD family transcriptional regulator